MNPSPVPSAGPNRLATSLLNGAEDCIGPRAFVANVRSLVLPKEHGSWSLALEPLALGLLIAPSLPAVPFSLAVVAAFFARRPMNIALREYRARRRAAARSAAFWCAGTAAVCFAATLLEAGSTWAMWLVPSAIAGVVFLNFDLRAAGRSQEAEVAGATAFALLPAAIAALAGWGTTAALAIALVMLGRALPTVLCVRAVLRGGKTGERHVIPAVAAALVAVIVGVALASGHMAPWTPAILFAVFLVRTLLLLVFPRPAVRARTLGIAEAVSGVAFVLATAAAWRL
jgi:hypothetical protein